MSATEYPQVGRGWAFPPSWTRDGGAASVVMNDGEKHVREAMVILLRTVIGSRVMRPGFGAGIDRYVFEPRTADVSYRLAEDVRRALMLGEPRIIVDTVDAAASPTVADRVDVTIEFRIDRHRRSTSLVIPFYVPGTR